MPYRRQVCMLAESKEIIVTPKKASQHATRLISSETVSELPRLFTPVSLRPSDMIGRSSSIRFSVSLSRVSMILKPSQIWYEHPFHETDITEVNCAWTVEKNECRLLCILDVSICAFQRRMISIPSWLHSSESVSRSLVSVRNTAVKNM